MLSAQEQQELAERPVSAPVWVRFTLAQIETRQRIAETHCREVAMTEAEFLAHSRFPLWQFYSDRVSGRPLRVVGTASKQPHRPETFYRVALLGDDGRVHFREIAGSNVELVVQWSVETQNEIKRLGNQASWFSDPLGILHVLTTARKIFK